MWLLVAHSCARPRKYTARLRSGTEPCRDASNDLYGCPRSVAGPDFGRDRPRRRRSDRLQRMREPMVVLATDGAPRDDYFWRRHGSREAYAELRKDEARCALGEAGVQHIVFLADRNCAFVDQELFRVLSQAFDALLGVIEEYQPTALLTLAYEGGHPDH